MPANGRWDLIRRLKVNLHIFSLVNLCFLCRSECIKSRVLIRDFIVNVFEVIELRRMNWDGQVERMWTGEMRTELESGNLKGRDYLKTSKYDDIIKTILINLDKRV